MSSETEYRSLRQEILDVSGRQFNLLTFAVTSSVILLGWGLQSETNKGLILLVPLLILGFAGTQLVGHAYSTMRVASYIQHVIEPNVDGLQWERFMDGYREVIAEQPGEYPTLAKSSWPSYELVLIAVGWVSVVLALFIVFLADQQQYEAQQYESVVSMSAAVIWLIFTFRLRKQMKMATSPDHISKELACLWGRVKKKEEECQGSH